MKPQLEGLTERMMLSASPLALPSLAAPMVATTNSPSSAAVGYEIAIPQHTASKGGTPAIAATTASSNSHSQSDPRTAIRPLVGANNYVWDPPNPQTDINANNPQNWLLNGNRQGVNGSLPGSQATDEVTFDPGNANITDGHGNSDIIWNVAKPFSTMHLGGVQAYTGRQTINPNVTVELTGMNGTSLDVPDTASNLYLNFGNGNAVFQIDNNATITNMKLVGSNNGLFQITGGTTSIAGNPGAGNPVYTETVGVPITITSGAMLNDWAYNTVTFTNDDVKILVDGFMNVYYGSGTGATLLDNGGNTHDYVDVNDGILTYLGHTGVKDTFNMPVLVEYLGSFNLSGFGGGSSGTLAVQGVVPGQTNNASVFMTGGSVNLANSATLECDNDYYQAGGALISVDTSKCTLQDGPQNKGIANIAGGKVEIAPSGFGELDVKCATLNFGGELDVDILGYTYNMKPGQSDLLQVVNGNINLLKGSSLVVGVFGQMVKSDNWIIIDSTQIGTQVGDGLINWQFSTETSNPQTNLRYYSNSPTAGQFQIVYPGS